MINWESGQVVEGEYIDSGMYVDIMGTRYPIMMPKIEGNTPVTAENLNKIFDYKDYSDKIKANDNVISLAANPQVLVQIGNLVFMRVSYNLVQNIIGTGSDLFEIPEQLRPSTNCRLVHKNNNADDNCITYLLASDGKIYVGGGSNFGASGTQGTIIGMWTI